MKRLSINFLPLDVRDKDDCKIYRGELFQGFFTYTKPPQIQIFKSNSIPKGRLGLHGSFNNSFRSSIDAPVPKTAEVNGVALNFIEESDDVWVANLWECVFIWHILFEGFCMPAVSYVGREPVKSENPEIKFLVKELGIAA